MTATSIPISHRPFAASETVTFRRKVTATNFTGLMESLYGDSRAKR
jgi:hypothetical protein